MRALFIVSLVLLTSISQAAPTLDIAAALKGPAHEAQTNITPLPVQPAACCKHCSKGKPCGNSCIARNKTCHKGPGCAC
ncbi:hypothetical protein CKO32_16735 [Afifella marina DSM 2698]|uniref:Metallothionein n=1 Tax=Afifella marina DSM 2698 TaxID=1120955 RepID=A0A1G5MHB2_AFIMA|nr:hypothetical protein [Afifella marina DSM 2698]MBK1628924.1 hypothetical protein [Afifella marina]MBK5918303.1 hypothetical protein [Afifella marina]RAI22822.1 hypothetical protein CH311_03995 [Afifella marina DSM 2698]SCZ23869.1 hypothetical protein SAMN03080610_00617 [Afifella marina DSM 2698]